jgi:hypothetical protein
LMKAKATHSGTCQACGCGQKLPYGQLSKHGYTTKWGFFSGICAGAGHLPYELSCDFIQTMIQNVTAQREQTVIERDALLVPATEPKGWVRHSTYDRASGRSVSKWELVEIRCDARAYESYTFYSFTYQMPFEVKGLKFDEATRSWLPPVTELRSYNCCEHSKATSAVEAATLCNARYAEVFTARIAEMSNYIKWQGERVTKWKLAPEKLIPVESAAKLAAKAQAAAEKEAALTPEQRRFRDNERAKSEAMRSFRRR